MKTFRPYKACDAEVIIKWLLNEKSYYQWSAGLIGKYPIAAENLNAFYDEQKNNPNYMVFVACDEKGKPVGQLFIKYIDETKEKVRFGFIVVDPTVRGKGYGKKLLGFAKKYAFEFLGAKEIGLGVFSNNPHAMHCYEAMGFKLTGETKKGEYMGEVWEGLEMKCIL